MKTYIYKGQKNFFFYDICIATFGDILRVKGEEICNISNKNKIYKVSKETINNLLLDCIEYNLNSEELNYKEFFLINKSTISKLINFGILKISKDSCRNYNIGKSNYSDHIIQPWAIWQDYNLNPWDADIIKRVLRTKEEKGMSKTEARIMDYEKIIHICKERLRQLQTSG